LTIEPCVFASSSIAAWDIITVVFRLMPISRSKAFTVASPIGTVGRQTARDVDQGVECRP
jgi:hypothetical protein